MDQVSVFRVIKTLIIVVIIFGLCWLPLQTFFLVLDFNPQLLANPSRADKLLVTVIYYIVFWLAMSNSCANPIIYGFTNESFRYDLAMLCYLQFPFCLCLKHMTIRKLSVSTCESVYNKRQGTVRNSTRTPISRQGICRNNNRVYIELEKDIERTRSQPNVGEHYQEIVENELKNYPNGVASHQSCHFQRNNHHQLVHHRSLFRTESGDSTQPLSTNNNFEFDERGSSASSVNDSDRKRSLNSSTTPNTVDLSFTTNSDRAVQTTSIL